MPFSQVVERYIKATVNLNLRSRIPLLLARNYTLNETWPQSPHKIAMVWCAPHYFFLCCCCLDHRLRSRILVGIYIEGDLCILYLSVRVCVYIYVVAPTNLRSMIC